MTEAALPWLGTPATVAPPVPVGPAVPGPGPGARGAGRDYAELRRRIREEGLLDRRPRYYAVKIAVMAALLAAGWAAFFALGDTWYQLLVAVYLAAVFGQIGFLGHEAGHRQIFRSRRGNELAGLVHGNLLIGLSLGWWTGKHHRHHAFQSARQGPRHHHPGAAFTAGQARERRGVARLLARYQAYLFFPMLLLEAVSMHVIKHAGGAGRAHPAPAAGRPAAPRARGWLSHGRPARPRQGRRAGG